MNSKTYLTILLLFSTNLIAQITGTVKDQSIGEPIQGVNIIAGEKGTTTKEGGKWQYNTIDRVMKFHYG